jgi:hypothetical protein
LIGYSSGGKTFIANRLRRELRLSPHWTASPGEQSIIKKTEHQIDWTEIVKHRGPSRRYLLADVDGDGYRASVAYLTDEPLEPRVWRRYVLLTALASAYVLVLPARADLNESDPFNTEKLVDRFDVIVGVMLTLHQRIREATDVRTAVNEPVTKDDWRKALREDIRCPQPVHVLFAQADRCDEVTKSERDPYVYAMRHATSLYQTIDKHFATHRFDFVSAFDGHQANSNYLVDYKCPTYGTLAAFEWIDRMISGGSLFRRTTAAAKAARRIFDPSFRRNATRTVGR